MTLFAAAPDSPAPVFSLDPFDLQKAVAGLMGGTSSRNPSTCTTRSACMSPFCPACKLRAGIQQKHHLMQITGTIPKARLKFATLKSREVGLSSLRDSTYRLVQAGRKTLRKLRIADFALRAEAPPGAYSEDFYPHLHVLADTPSSGRGYVSQAAWDEEWLAQLPKDLHPLQVSPNSATHVESVRDVGGACGYISKSPFAKCADIPAVRRVLDSIAALKGSLLVNLRGAFAV